mmetsp:Transcript_10819/g.15255  ORF Transcript_10819/g.15255 Transcript_10819/m.15255 type:complete len:529 (+) Transcript_10819:911-2497(+)
MVVLDKHSYVFDSSPHRTCDVLPFDPSLGAAQEVPIVDGALAYDCPFSCKTFILLFRNALHVSHLDHNLIPPFILREAGLKLNQTAKIHVNQPTTLDHAIISKENNLKIPLALNGTFSFFRTRVPTPQELESCDTIFFTPDSYTWNPYSDHFSNNNKDSMIDWNGNINVYRNRNESEEIAVGCNLYDKEIDKIISSSILNIEESIDGKQLNSGAAIDGKTTSLAILKLLTDSKMVQSIGSTQYPDTYEDDLFSLHDGDTMYDIFVDGTNLNDFENLPIEVSSTLMIVSAVTASNPKKINKTFLSKIWRVKEDDAQKALDQSTILMRKGSMNALSKRFPTNDRMLRYRRLNSHFFTDTFFSKVKSLRGFTCAQVYVSDKGFLDIYLMKRRGEFKQSLHQFCKETGVLIALVCDPSGGQTSNEVKPFCNQVGTTLRVLEESTQWANRDKLYIGFLKEAIRQDMRSTNSPLCLWCYCAQRRVRIHNVIPKDLFQLQGSNPITATLGLQPDISNICQYGWYDWCYFREESDI